MMRTKLTVALLIAAFLMSLGSFAVQDSSAAMRQAPTVRNMKITGEIVKAHQGYIIRGKVPAEIFTILNPDPDTLDAIAKDGKALHIEVRIVSGDNVEIEKIGGKAYRPKK